MISRIFNTIKLHLKTVGLLCINRYSSLNHDCLTKASRAIQGEEIILFRKFVLWLWDTHMKEKKKKNFYTLPHGIYDIYFSRFLYKNWKLKLLNLQDKMPENLQNKQSLGPDNFTGKFNQTLKEAKKLHKLHAQNWKGTLSNSLLRPA